MPLIFVLFLTVNGLNNKQSDLINHWQINQQLKWFVAALNIFII